MTQLPVREIVLYKHGVGFFVRQGTFTGEEIALTFRQDEINDVLKSLAVFDQSGGQIQGIHYQTPMDIEARLASSSIHLSREGSLRDLLRDLRGRRAKMTFEVTAGTLEEISGRVIGIDDMGKTIAQRSHQIGVAANPDSVAPARVGILTDNGQAAYFLLSDLRQLVIEDEQAAYDLTYFLDTSQAEGDRRIVNVRLDEGDHDLVVYYVAPAPTWRVSYRLVAEIDAENPAQGKALLQGWGLFDNRLDEDLDAVRVTLVAGQPISFIYELYASRIPHRPTVQDEQRIAPGPIEFEGAADMAFAAAEMPDWLADAAPAARSAGFGSMPAPAPAPQLLRLQKAAAAQSMQPGAEGKAAGETFQYVVKNAVTVKRGESALVPIIGSEIAYERELLYNGAKLPTHPIAALRFTNSTGLTLERGPVTVVEDGDYKGEAVIPFTKEDNQVYVPYAVELGIKVVEVPISRTETYGIEIEGKYLYETDYYTSGTTFTIENGTSKAQTITIEIARPALEITPTLYNTPQPDVATAEFWRWRVETGARKSAEFTYTTRITRRRREEIRNLSYRSLGSYLQQQWIDDALHGGLKAILDLLGQIQQLQQNGTKLEKERHALYQQQEQHRANLGALQPTGQEAALRNRILKQLEHSQDRLEAIDAEIVQIDGQVKINEQRVDEMIAALSPTPRR